MNKHLLKEYTALLRQRGLLLEEHLTEGLASREVSLLSYNSAEVVPGTLFVAKGAGFKAAYLADAVARGAFAYVTDRGLFEKMTAGLADLSGVPHILVTDIRLALSCLSAFYFGEPAASLTVVGIGGTKGKSSTTFFLEHILSAYDEQAGRPAPAYLSTVETYDGVSRQVSHITTPESYEIHRHFRNAVDSGIREAVMEVSSQAFKVKRVPDVRFDIGIFTNISEDHISPIEHPDFDDYYNCKMEMFAQTGTALVNLNADLADRTLATARRDSDRVLTYAAQYGTGPVPEADYLAYDIRKDGFNTVFKVHLSDAAGAACGNGGDDPEFVLSVPGLFNVENAVAAIAAAHLLGVPVSVMQEALPSARVPGRMEFFHTADKRVIAIVDYAHNKLSFEKLFESARAEYPGRTLITVFGATGGKGVNRRYDLGRTAGRLADYAVISSDDPGPEPFADIAAGIVSAFEEGFAERPCTPARTAGASGRAASGGVASGNACDHYTVIEDRRTAVRAAFERAAALPEGAVVLAAGRGRDRSMKIGTEYLPYPSDVECVTECIAEYDAAR